MKKINKIIIFVLMLMLSTNVYAASGSTSISGTNTVKVGKTTKIYIKLNSSDLIEGVDVEYQATGNITVTNATINSGLTKMGQNGNRYILYAPSPLNSGSTILTLTVKGTKEGTGTITVNKMEATVSGTTVNGGTKSYNITVNPAKTEAEIEAEEEAKKKAEEQQKKEEEEYQKALTEATKLVEAAEKSLNHDDYESALSAVNNLKDGEDKTKLLDRLDEVKFSIEVNKAALEKCNTTDNTCNCKDTSCVKWMILSLILFIGLLSESAYLLFKKN